MQLDSTPHRRQHYLPQTPEEVSAYRAAEQRRDEAAMKRFSPKPTSWEDAASKKAVFEKAIKAYDKTQKQLAEDRAALDKAAHAYFHAIPVTDSTLYSECPFSPRRIDAYMSRNMYKLAEELFRWLAPRTFQSVTEIKSFLDEMLPAAEWGMKMRNVESKAQKPNISPEAPAEELF